MDTHALEAGELPNAAPWPLQVCYVLAFQPSREDVGIAWDYGQVIQDGAGGRGQGNASRAGLGVRELYVVVLHVVPFQGLDFATAAAGEG